MLAPQIVLNVHGGLVQEIFASDDALELLIVDWDVAHADHLEPGVVAVPLAGRLAHAIVARPNPVPLTRLAGTDVQAAIEAAAQQGVLVDAIE